MFSVIKRLISNNDIETLPRNVKSHQIMPNNLQIHFSKGIDYNMKIIIKGDKTTGKSCLFDRLQGKKFIINYIPTEEIQVGSIHWKYKNTNDIVKIEVWEIVDKSKKNYNKKYRYFKNSNYPSLDAEFINVYKGCNCIIFIFDITKKLTFSYVQREIVNVPTNLPILIMGNFIDRSHHREVTNDEIKLFVKSVQESVNVPIKYTESSMANGFGLKYLYTFISIPFLILQKKNLLIKLENNKKNSELSIKELNDYEKHPDADYNNFLETLTINKGIKLKNDHLDNINKSIIIEKKYIIENHDKKLNQIEDYIAVNDESLNKFLQEETTQFDIEVSSKCSDIEEENCVNPLVAEFQDYIETSDKLK